MPANSLNVISVVADVVGLPGYTFSAADDWAALSKIGAGGTSLALPSDPSGGDNFGFFDADGTCSPTSPIHLSAEDGKSVNGQTSGLTFTVPFSSARAVFDERIGGWTVVSAAPDAALLFARAWADNPQQVTLTTTNPTIIASASVAPRVTGKLRVIVTGTLTSSAGMPTNAVLSLSLGGSATPAVYSQGPANAPPSSSVWASLIVDLDKVPSPPSTPIGTAVEVNAVLTVATAGVVDVPAHGLQIDVEEVP
jgi:hypothetical protein